MKESKTRTCRGAGEHNPDLMLGLSELGDGRYYFVESAAAIFGALILCFATVRGAYFSQAKIFTDIYRYLLICIYKSYL